MAEKPLSWHRTYSLELAVQYGSLSSSHKPKGSLSVLLLCTNFSSGLGQSIQQVIVGRLIAGVGGAGVNCLVAIVIAGKQFSKSLYPHTLTCESLDMMPIREVASWRGYVNIAATSGRSLGGPIGGFLTDTIGWRWWIPL